jgi:hypothetical protein
MLQNRLITGYVKSFTMFLASEIARARTATYMHFCQMSAKTII